MKIPRKGCKNINLKRLKKNKQ